MAPLCVQLPTLHLPQLNQEAKLAGAALGAAAAAGAVYLLVKRANRAAVAKEDWEITTLEDWDKYCNGGALRDVVVGMFTARSVIAVRVTDHGIASLPRSLFSLKLMRELNLSGNSLTQLPEALGRLTALQTLNVAGNKLTRLPEELGALTRLTELNAMGNQLEELPVSLGSLHALQRLGLKDNRLASLPPTIGQLTALEQLFLTGNELSELPEEIGGCISLVKIQASHNKLTSLPQQLAGLPNLEFLRVSCCDIAEVPDSFAGAEALAWLSLATNPACGKTSPRRSGVPAVQIDELQVGNILGCGASGDVFDATWRGRRVALKLFRSELSPDGHSRDEMAVACALSDKHLVKVLATVEEPLGLVMEYVEGSTLAEKPNAESLLRCRWADGAAYSLPFVLRVAHGVAAALEHMHYRSAAHGDVYAHNVMADDEGHAVLCDYGAAFFYAKGSPLAAAYEGQDVRAFGLLLRDLAHRVDIAFDGMEAALDAQKQLLMLVQQCTTGPPARRPRFGAVGRKLRSLQKAVGQGSGLTPRSDSRLSVREVAVEGRKGYATTR